jgi:hypothetical protein
VNSEDTPGTLELIWHGPYRWFDDRGKAVFAADIASRYGIYMWTVPLAGSYLAYYVGETGPSRSFAKRLHEHAKAYLSGVYRVHEPSAFGAGKQQLIWPGTWYGPIGPSWPPFEYVRPQLFQSLAQLQLLIAPLCLPDLRLETEKRIRKRVEGAVASATQRYPRPKEPKGGFQEPGIRYANRKQGELPVRVVVECPVHVLGLDQELAA